jgi:hypothetical protein
MNQRNGLVSLQKAIEIHHEIINQTFEQSTMIWEDDRSKLIEESKKVLEQNERLKRHLSTLNKRYHDITSSVEVLKKSKNITNEEYSNNKVNKSSIINTTTSCLEYPTVKDKLNIMGIKSSAKIHDKEEKLEEFSPKSTTSTPVFSSIPPRVKYHESTRIKSERESMPGHTCIDCFRLYQAFEQQGIIISSEKKRELLQTCSRHKVHWSPPHTPPGFWDLSVHTPENWK